MENLSDAELVEQIADGSSAALEELIHRYSHKAFNLAFRLVGNKDDAEETLQDVFTQVFRKAKDFQGKSQVSSWLYRVTVNAGLMKIRKRKQERSQLIEDVLPSYNNSIALRADHKREGDTATFIIELKTELAKAIELLPEDYKPVFILRDVDGLSSEEVGSLLGISIPAVKSRLHRSRMLLRKSLLPLYKDVVSNEKVLKSTGTDC